MTKGEEQMKVEPFVYVRMVTHANEGIKEAVQRDDLDPLRNSPACSRCTDYLIASRKRDHARIDVNRESRRALTLLFTLAAMRLGDEHDVLEGLRLINARGVDTLGRPVSHRFRMAGEARKKPIRSERYYVRSGIAERTEKRLAEELYNILTDDEILCCALEAEGPKAVATHI
jgi:hypothetical protein